MRSASARARLAVTSQKGVTWGPKGRDPWRMVVGGARGRTAPSCMQLLPPVSDPHGVVSAMGPTQNQAGVEAPS